MCADYDNESQLYDTRYSKNKDVRKMQEALHDGSSIVKVYKSMGFDDKYALQIFKYLGYREWHIYDTEIIEFDEWKQRGEPKR